MDGSTITTDTLLILKSTENKRLTKALYLDDKGNTCVEDYDEGARLFSFHEHELVGLEDLQTLLSSMGQDVCAVFGKMIEGTDAACARRLTRQQTDGTKPTIEGTAHNLLPLDLEEFEAIDADGAFDWIADPERTVRLAQSKLPPAFDGVDCLWQLTSGAGVKQGIRLRLWFWLSQKHTAAQVVRLLKHCLLKNKNRKDWEPDPTRFVDPSIFQRVNQPIYCAAPVIGEGVKDPAPVRTGFYKGILGIGAVVVPEVVEGDDGEENSGGANDDDNEREEYAATQGPDEVDYDSDETIDWAIELIRKDLGENGIPIEHKGSDERTFNLIGRLRDGPAWGRSVSRNKIAELLEKHWGPHLKRDNWFYKKARNKSYRNGPGVGQAGSDERRYGAQAAGIQDFLAKHPELEAQRQANWDKQERAQANAGDADDIMGARKKTGANPRVCMQSLSDLRKTPPLVDLVDGLLVDNENCALVATPKSGKTYLALDINLSVSSGLPVLNKYAVNPTRAKQWCIYLSGEGHSGFWRRCKAWAESRGMSEEDLLKLPFIYNKGVPLAAGGMSEARAFIEAAKARIEANGGEVALVTIDTMARSLAGLKENESDAATAYLDLTEGLRSGLNCATLTLAHASNKEFAVKKGQRLDFRGTSAFSAGFDSTWIMDKNEETKTVTLEGRWFKECDEDTRKDIHFRLVRQPNGAAALQHIDIPPQEARTRSAAEQKNDEQRNHDLKLQMQIATALAQITETEKDYVGDMEIFQILDPKQPGETNDSYIDRSDKWGRMIMELSLRPSPGRKTTGGHAIGCLYDFAHHTSLGSHFKPAQFCLPNSWREVVKKSDAGISD